MNTVELKPGMKVEVRNVNHPIKNGVVICKSQNIPTQYLVENDRISSILGPKKGRAWFYPENLF